jgi:hypothetical protein
MLHNVQQFFYQLQRNFNTPDALRTIYANCLAPKGSDIDNDTPQVRADKVAK